MMLNVKGIHAHTFRKHPKFRKKNFGPILLVFSHRTLKKFPACIFFNQI